jgi:hypothetical protein
MAGWLRLVLAFYFLGTIMAIPGSILLVEYEKHFYQQHRNAICNEKNGRGSQDSCERKARDEAADAYSPFPNIQISTDSYFIFNVADGFNNSVGPSRV